MSLNPIQEEIKKALAALGDHARFSEAVLAKKIRENAGIEGKKKAGICLLDLEKALESLEEENLHYSLMMNSANDLLIEKTENDRPLEGEVRQRRLKSEKSISLFTNGDLSAGRGGKNSGGKNGSGKGSCKSGKAGGMKKNRSERKHINVNSDFEDFE